MFGNQVHKNMEYENLIKKIKINAMSQNLQENFATMPKIEERKSYQEPRVNIEPNHRDYLEPELAKIKEEEEPSYLMSHSNYDKNERLENFEGYNKYEQT